MRAFFRVGLMMLMIAMFLGVGSGCAKFRAKRSPPDQLTPKYAATKTPSQMAVFSPTYASFLGPEKGIMIVAPPGWQANVNFTKEEYDVQCVFFLTYDTDKSSAMSQGRIDRAIPDMSLEAQAILEQTFMLSSGDFESVDAPVKFGDGYVIKMTYSIVKGEGAQQTQHLANGGVYILPLKSNPGILLFVLVIGRSEEGYDHMKMLEEALSSVRVVDTNF
jgi:hypothetical protein